MVIEAGVQPRVVVPFTRNHDQVSLGASAACRAHDLPNRLGEGIRTARALVGQDPRAEIHVFTDGAHPAAAAGPGRRRAGALGRRRPARAATSASPACAVRRNYFGAFNSQAFMSVANFSAEAADLLAHAHARRRDARREDADARSRRCGAPSSCRSPIRGGGVVRLRLNVSDDLDADNVAYAVMPPPRQIAVLLVSPGNLFLEKALKTDPQVKLEVQQARRVPGRHGGLRRRRASTARARTRIGNGRFVLVNTVPARRAARGAGASREPGHHGLGPDAPDHAPARLRQGHDRGRHAGAAARRRQDPGGGRGRSARLHARGAGSQGGVLRLRPVQDRFPAARGLPADAVEEPPVAAPGRPRSVEPARCRRASPSCSPSSTG